MKKLFYLFFILFFCFLQNNNAQQVFPAKGAEWYYVNGSSQAYKNGISRLKYQKDTLISGKTYAKVTEESIYFSHNKPPYISKYYGNLFFRLENSNIWNYSNGKDELLWKINQKVGDKFSVSSFNGLVNFQVTKIETKVIDNKSILSTTVVGQNQQKKVIYDMIAPEGNLNLAPCGLGTVLDCYDNDTLCYYRDNTLGNINFLGFKNCKSLFEKTVSINDFSIENDIMISPNPTNQILTILTRDIDVEKVMIIDKSGKIIQNLNIIDYSDKFEIDVSNFSSDLYFLKVISKNNSCTKKFVKIQ